MACIVEEMIKNLEARAKTLDPVRQKAMQDLATQLKDVIPKKEGTETGTAGGRISTAQFVKEYLIDTRDTRHSASNEAKRVFRDKYRELSGKNSIQQKSLEKIASGLGALDNATRNYVYEAAQHTMDTMGSQPQFAGQFDVEVTVANYNEVAAQDAEALRPDKKGKC